MDSGKIDGKIRGIRLVRADSADAVLFTLSAHRNIHQSSRKFSISSADYPGKNCYNCSKKRATSRCFMSGDGGEVIGFNGARWPAMLAPELLEPVVVAHLGREPRAR